MIPRIRTHYEVLHIQREATFHEIKDAFHELAMIHHPDKGGDAEEFKAISLAYEILRDETKRFIYDAHLPEIIDSQKEKTSTHSSAFFSHCPQAKEPIAVSLPVVAAIIPGYKSSSTKQCTKVMHMGDPETGRELFVKHTKEKNFIPAFGENFIAKMRKATAEDNLPQNIIDSLYNDYLKDAEVYLFFGNEQHPVNKWVKFVKKIHNNLEIFAVHYDKEAHTIELLPYDEEQHKCLQPEIGHISQAASIEDVLINQLILSSKNRDNNDEQKSCICSIM